MTGIISGRRGALVGTALAAAGAAAGAASQARAQAGVRSPFAVAQATVPIVGGEQVLPVRRIYCIGRNYAAHAREMGSDPNREPPFFFQKPSDAVQVVLPGVVVDHAYPPLTKNYHHEIELVAALGRGGRDVPIDRALDLVYGYAIGLIGVARTSQPTFRQ